MANSVFKVSGEVKAKFHQKPDLSRKVWSAQNFRFSKPVEFLTVVTHKSLTVFGTSGASVNPRPKSLVPFSCCFVPNRFH
jgi:hypothetical protein